MSDFYIPRRLLVGDRTCSEEQLLNAGTLFIVLAEPGAGKTKLLTKLSTLLGCLPIRADLFRLRQPSVPGAALVIDAMDEVARIDRLALTEIVVKASELQSRITIFAGRSSEWDSSSTQQIADYFGSDPIAVRLEAFTQDEQRSLFEENFPGERFDEFEREAERFELVPLFGNPQFLQLFGEAYIEKRCFTTKKAIFADAARRLAHETNHRVWHPNRPSIDRIVDLSGELFAKLLLSGAPGVSASETLDEAAYPYLGVLLSSAVQHARYLLDPAAEAHRRHRPTRACSPHCR